jgi:hypothetical protein
LRGNRHDASTPSLQRRSPAQSAQQDRAGTPLPIRDWAAGMEHLWSQAGATGGNSSQGRSARQRFKQTDPQPVATDGNSSGAHGKEGPTVRVRQRALQIGQFRDYRVPLDHGGTHELARQGQLKQGRQSLQIGVLSDSPGHLPETEGLHVACVVGVTTSRWKGRHSGFRCRGPRILGTGLGDRTSPATGIWGAQVTADLYRPAVDVEG